MPRGQAGSKGARALLLRAALLPALWLLACATYSDRTQSTREALNRGDLSSAVTELNRFLGVRTAEALPDKLEHSSGLALLERATVLHAMRRWDVSARDFEFADKQLELLDIANDAGGKIGKWVYSDSATKYKTSPTEKLALNAFNMLNYLARGKLEGAKIEAKRFTVMRKYLSDYDPKHAHGAFGSYVAGFVHEQLGEAESALRYYDEALAEHDLVGLREPVVRLARRSGYRGEHLKRYLPAEDTAMPTPASDATDDAGEILVLAATGRVPHKEPRRIPIGAAVGLAGAFVTGDATVLEYGMFKVVVYPELVPAVTVFDRATVSIDGKPVAVDLVSDLGVELAREYDELRPRIIGAALTRMIVRAAAAEGARVAGQQAEGAGALVGFLAAAAVEGTMVALDRPDTRSWTTLPQRVYIGRARVPAGDHTVEVVLSGPGGTQRSQFEVNVPRGGFDVLDVTSLR